MTNGNTCNIATPNTGTTVGLDELYKKIANDLLDHYLPAVTDTAQQIVADRFNYSREDLAVIIDMEDSPREMGHPSLQDAVAEEEIRLLRKVVLQAILYWDGIEAKPTTPTVKDTPEETEAEEETEEMPMELEVRRYSENGRYTVEETLRFYRSDFPGGQLPNIVCLPSGAMAYKYGDHYCVENGLYATSADLKTPVKSSK